MEIHWPKPTLFFKTCAGFGFAMLLGIAPAYDAHAVPHTSKPASDVKREIKSPSIEAFVAPATASIDDDILLDIRTRHRLDLQVRMQELSANLGGLRLQEAEAPKSETLQGIVYSHFRYRLRADVAGSYVVPPIEAFFYPGDTQDLQVPVAQRQTHEIFIEILPALNPNEEKEINDENQLRDIKPLQKPRNLLPWAILAGIALVAAILLALWLYLRRRARSNQETKLSPQEVAYGALKQLRSQSHTSKQACRAYYFQISFIVRRYIEDQCGIPACDRTSEEIIHSLAQPHTVALPPLEKDRLRAFLIDTDAVKFANHAPTEADMLDVYRCAIALIEATTPIEPSSDFDQSPNRDSNSEPGAQDAVDR